MSAKRKSKGLHPQKQCLYNVEWQALRVSMLGDWTTYEGTKRNLEKVRFYLDRKYPNITITHVWRVLNLLNAVRMGYSGQKRTGSPQDKLVALFRNKVSETYHQMKKITKVFDVDSPAEIKTAFEALTICERQAIVSDLSKRRQLHANSEFRDELSWFLEVINEA